MVEERLEGGYCDGAVRVGDTVRRQAGPWTPAVHALLFYLAGQGFTGAPRPLGFDDQGREVLTFLDGETVGRRKPRPAWVHAEDTLVQVARWMRDYHQVVAGFVPPPDAVWRDGGTWSPGLIIAHNDATTHNSAWRQGQLTGFFDWDVAGPAAPAWDLAMTGYAWVPLHARFLDAYGWPGTIGEFLEVVDVRMTAHADKIRAGAATGDEACGRLLHQGVADAVDQALADLAHFPR